MSRTIEHNCTYTPSCFTGPQPCDGTGPTERSGHMRNGWWILPLGIIGTVLWVVILWAALS